MIGDAFRESFDLIKEHKGIIIPGIVATLVTFVLVLLAVQVTGAGEAVREFQTLLEEYDEVQANETFNDFDPQNKGDWLAAGSYITGKGSYKKGMGPYLESKGFTWNKFTDLLTQQNIILVSVITVFGLLFGLYCRSATYGMAALAVTGQDTDFGSTLGMANKFWWRFLFIRIILSAILFLPFFIAGGIVFLAFKLNPIVAIIATVLFGFLLLIVTTYLSTKLLFSISALFVDEEGIFSSIGESWNLVKGQFWMVFVVGLIIYGIGSLGQSFLGNPANSSSGVILFGTGAGKIALSAVLMIIFVVLVNVVNAFRDLFYFAVYEEAKTRKL
ncbi:MAG: hypothetical protein QGG83_05030 [Candidatus Woesearchaeota archaeon]|jgi:hypothetical protein|nr:hypothetical protein [Candidatus Woesearchaeota archaeon]MDP7181989.1 hypothetical protein [Candidatus Woesearchaeota archaeon]